MTYMVLFSDNQIADIYRTISSDKDFSGIFLSVIFGNQKTT